MEADLPLGEYVQTEEAAIRLKADNYNREANVSKHLVKIVKKTILTSKTS